jgi:hypothetical protein
MLTSWDESQHITKPLTRREQIYQWICTYADEMDGPTPSINEIAKHFEINYKTAYVHVLRLIADQRLRQERGKLVVVGSDWIEPDFFPMAKVRP